MGFLVTSLLVDQVGHFNMMPVTLRLLLLYVTSHTGKVDFSQDKLNLIWTTLTEHHEVEK